MKLISEKRELTTRGFRFFAPIVSILVALFVAGFLLLAAGVNPLQAYLEIVQEALGSLYGLSETLVKTTPLIFASLGVSLAFRMQIWNIGAEGQIYMGACGATAVALFSGLEQPIVMITAMFFAAFLCGGLWAGVAGLLLLLWFVPAAAEQPGDLYAAEVAVADTLIQALPPELPLLVTTVTPTGQARARARFGERAAVAYLPFEISPVVRRVYDRYAPRALILLDMVGDRDLNIPMEGFSVQGNLDPMALYGTQDGIRRRALEICGEALGASWSVRSTPQPCPTR